MEHYFLLHHIQDEIDKPNMGALYLDSECWQCHRKYYGRYVAWIYLLKTFVLILIKIHIFWRHLTKLQHIGSMKEFITTFQQLAIYIEGLVNYFYTKCFNSCPCPHATPY